MHTIQVVLTTVLIFFLIVSIHEFGHFYFARRAGILVREFAIGFGPKLFSIKRGETRFTLRLLPVGGFVRMAGEDPEAVEVKPGHTVAVRIRDDKVTRFYLDRLDERANALRGEVKAVDLERELYVLLDVDGDLQRYAVHSQAVLVARDQETQIAPHDRQYPNKPVRKRAMAIFAGPLMNFVLAFLLFGVYLLMVGVPDENSQKVFVNGLAPQEQGQPPTPALVAGLQKGDWIKVVDGEPVGGDSNALVERIQASAGKPMHWIVERDGRDVEITVTPDPQTKTIGFYPAPEMRTATFGETVRFAGQSMVVMTELIFDSLRMLITDFNLDDIGGPVKTTQVTYEIAKEGLPEATRWCAMLSLYLGIFNLLPIPALDGSRLLFLGLEAVRGKPVDPGRESMVHLVGFAMLMLLMVVVTYNDILGLVRN